MVRGVTHRLLVGEGENTERRKHGRALLNNLLKPCDDSGSISSEGCAAIKINDVILMRFEYYRKFSLMAWFCQMVAIKHRDDIANEVASELKLLGGDWKFKERELEEAMKSMLKDIPGSPLLEGDEAVACRT